MSTKETISSNGFHHVYIAPNENDDYRLYVYIQSDYPGAIRDYCECACFPVDSVEGKLIIKVFGDL